MRSSLSLKRVFLPRSYTAEYDAEFMLHAHHLCVLVDRALKELVPVAAFKGEPIINIKGRDAGNLLLANWTLSHHPKGDELAFVTGTVPALNEESGAEDFAVRISSKFESFPTNATIEHSTRIGRSEKLPQFLKTQELGRVFPLKLNSFRLGLEYFHNNYRGPLSGISPAVTESIVIDCIGDQVKLKVVAEKLKKKETLPFEKAGLFDVLASIISDVSEVNLIEDYRRQAQAA